MPLVKKPINGMKDILPPEMRLRDYLISLVKETYRSFGFTPIETPVMESLGNLLSKQGGDNEKLIFKVLKRGEKLRINEAQTEEDLSDSGLRYDLTVPLVRYYSNNEAELPKPFKALQIGPVFRADRPQRGRFRQFYQCDIDIIGEAGNLAETELILATCTLLNKVGFRDFKVKINDRRLLTATADYCGVSRECCGQMFVIMDKLDKIGMDGVCRELCEAGFEASVSEKLQAFFAAFEGGKPSLDLFAELLGNYADPEVVTNLKSIIAAASSADGAYDLVFEPTLVRGMGYYTGPVFEIEIADFGASCGGGGRYDGMVEKFTGRSVPACGFSIGFERIITILLEQGFKIPDERRRVAFLIEKNMPGERMAQIISEAGDLRREGCEVSLLTMAKNKKFQKSQLEAAGIEEIKEYFINPIQ